MTRRTTFTNEQLCVSWAKHANTEPKGTRADVVVDMLAAAGLEATDENKKKCYNNVTQRVAQLKTNKTQAVTFPALAEGKKGARRTSGDLTALQALLNGTADQDEDEGDQDEEGDEADAQDAVEAATDAVENPEE